VSRLRAAPTELFFVQWSSTAAFNLFVRVPPHIISLQLCTPKVVGAQFKLYTVYNLHLK
jgi:hypothetical protein